MSKDFKLRDVFEHHGKHVKFDQALLDSIMKFNNHWLGRGEHMEFVVGHTIGEQTLTWSVDDEHTLFTDICGMDSREVRKEITHITKDGPGGQVLSNHKYYLLTWLMCGFVNSKLSLEIKAKAIRQVYFVFAYMKMASLHNSTRFANYKPSHSLATATYESLTKQVVIKKYGNWQHVFINVAKRFLPKDKTLDTHEDGIHYPRIKRGNDNDYERINMDNSTTLTNYMNYYYGVMMEIAANGEANNTISSMLMDDGEGGEVLKDVVETPAKYSKYLKDISTSPLDFVRPKLIHIVGLVMGNLEEDRLKETLVYMSKTYVENSTRYNRLYDIAIVHAVNYLNRQGLGGDKMVDRLEETLEYLRGRLLTSKGQDEDMAHFKDEAKDIVLLGTGRKSRPMLITTSIGLNLYLVLRGIVLKTI